MSSKEKGGPGESWHHGVQLLARVSIPHCKAECSSNNDNPWNLMGTSGLNSSVFAKHFGIDGWKEAVE